MPEVYFMPPDTGHDEFIESIVFILAAHGCQTVKLLKKKKEKPFSKDFSFVICRGDRIRTCDHLVPNQARYRAALHPATKPFLICECKDKLFLPNQQI